MHIFKHYVRLPPNCLFYRKPLLREIPLAALHKQEHKWLSHSYTQSQGQPQIWIQTPCSLQCHLLFGSTGGVIHPPKPSCSLLPNWDISVCPISFIGQIVISNNNPILSKWWTLKIIKHWIIIAYWLEIGVLKSDNSGFRFWICHLPSLSKFLSFSGFKCFYLKLE